MKRCERCAGPVRWNRYYSPKIANYAEVVSCAACGWEKRTDA